MSTEDEKLLKEAKKLPWEDRLVHKNWKVRNDANIDLAALCDSITDPKDPRLREFGSFFRKTVADSNAPVQEKALDALISFLKAADADVGRYAKEVCDAVVAKCLTGRPKTVEKSQMVFMLWVELEAVDAFLDAMEKAIKNKVAKAVVPAIDVMFQALSEFGAKIVPPKRILKMLPELFDHQDQNVRASSKGLTLELCRWIGKEPVKSILFEKMRDTMVKIPSSPSWTWRKLLQIHSLIQQFIKYEIGDGSKDLQDCEWMLVMLDSLRVGVGYSVSNGRRHSLVDIFNLLAGVGLLCYSVSDGRRHSLDIHYFVCTYSISVSNGRRHSLDGSYALYYFCLHGRRHSLVDMCSLLVCGSAALKYSIVASII